MLIIFFLYKYNIFNQQYKMIIFYIRYTYCKTVWNRCHNNIHHTRAKLSSDWRLPLVLKCVPCAVSVPTPLVPIPLPGRSAVASFPNRYSPTGTRRQPERFVRYKIITKDHYRTICKWVRARVSRVRFEIGSKENKYCIRQLGQRSRLT